MMDMHIKIPVLGYWRVKKVHFSILILNMEHSKCCSHLSSSSFMLKGQLPKPVLCSIASGPKFSLKVRTPVHQHSSKFTATLLWVPGQQGRMPRSSHGTEPCAHSQGGWRLPTGHQLTAILFCGAWHPPGHSKLPLPKHSSPRPQGKPSLSALLRRAGSGGFSCSTETHLHQRREGKGTRAGVHSRIFDSSYLSNSQDTVISDKGKICLERDLATHCLILVFWYFIES